jgi:hypothetical protein
MSAAFQFSSPSKHRQDESMISGRNTELDRHVTKYISSRDNTTLEETV